MKTPSGPNANTGAPLGVLTVDTALTVRTWSPWLETASGITAADAVGRPLGEVVPEIAARGLLEHFARVLRTGEAHVLAPAFHHYLVPCVPAAPSPHFDRMQQFVTLAALTEGGRVAGVLVTIEDVTPRLDAERTLAAELRSADPAARGRAEARLREAAGAGEEGAVVNVLGTPDWQVRRAAVDGLSSHASAELVSSLIAALRHQHRDFNVLGSALQLLSRMDVDVAGPLAALLQERDPDLRIQAALALGEHPGPVAAAALMAALGDDNVNVRFHAIESLGRLRWPDAVEPLAAIAESRDFFLAFPAVDALSRIADPCVAPRLLPLLDDDALVVPVAEALGQTAGAEAVQPLAAVLDRPDAPVAAIAAAVAMLHERYEREYRGGDYIAAEFQEALTPARAARILSAVPAARASELPALVRLLTWVPDAEHALVGLLARPDVRREAIEALVRRGSPTVGEALAAHLASAGTEDEEVQIAVLDALGRLGDRRAGRAVAAMLGRGRALTVAAAGTLARIGAVSEVDPLLALLSDPDAAIRQAAVGALSSLGDASMADRICALLASDEPYARESAVRIAGYFGYPQCRDGVLACLEDPDVAVRRAAVEQIPHLDVDDGLSLLSRILADETPKIRAAAASALGRVAGGGPPLTTALGDPDPWVRYFAAKSLARQEYAPARETLARASDGDAAPFVRIAALEALGAIGGAAAVAVLERHARSDDGAIAAAALEALGATRDAGGQAAVLEALQATETGRRVAAAGALAARGDVQAVAALRWTAGAEPTSEIGRAVLAALGRVAAGKAAGAAAAVEALLELTGSPDAREAAIAALAGVPEDRVGLVAAGFSHPAPAVRRATVDALVRMRAASASAAVREALAHEDPAVREAAIVALDRVGTRGLGETFGRLAAEDPSPAVRRVAAAARTRTVR